MAEHFLDQVLLLQVTIGLPGNTRQVETYKQIQFAEDNEAEQNTVKITKTLFTKSNCPEFHAIVGFDARLRKWVEQRSLPNPYGTGIYMIPEGVAQEVNEHISRVFPQQREDLVTALGAVYPRRIRDAQREMGQLFAPLDFPDFEEYSKGFKYRYMYRPKGVDDSLYILGQEARAEQEAQIHQEVQETRDLITLTLRSEFANLVTDMVGRLAPDAKGRRKKFHNSSIESFNRWLELFESRNLLGDEDLNNQVRAAREIMTSATPDMLRSDNDLRDHVREGFSRVKKYVDENLAPDQRVRVIR